MKIIVKSGKSSFTLAAGDTESPVELAINETRVSQIDELYEAIEVSCRDRGNRKTTISFNIDREHEDLLASETFMLTHPGEVPSSGDVVFIAEGGKGGNTNRYLYGAVIMSVGGRQMGCNTTHSYAIVGGAFQIK